PPPPASPTMARPNLIAQIYGYLVCLIAVITFLISGNSLVGNVINLSDPMSAQGHGREVLASFELYREDAIARRAGPDRRLADQPVPPDEQLRRMYDAALADRVRIARHQATRSVVTSGLLLLASIALFATHWLWMRRLRRTEGE
ncbi:MAG: hypothetical protein M3373_09705, partial [Gemmatimonadota bacterium]|nr:hypothetical protein [Gemmatimonadota bacterium]